MAGLHGLAAGSTALIALGWGVLLFLPRLTRPEIYFGVTVAGGFRDSAEGRRAYARYRHEEMVHLAGSLLLYAWAGASGQAAPAMAAIAWMLSGTLHAYLRARHQVLPHAAAASAVREAALDGAEADVGPAWLGLMAPPFAALALAYGWAAAHREALPASYATHWNLAGEADRWATAGEYHPAMHLLAGCLMALLVMLLPFVALRYSRHIAAAGEAAAAERRFRRAMLALCAGAGWMVAAMFALTMVQPLLPGSGPAPQLWVAAAGMAWLVAMVIYLVRLGQGGTRLAPAGPSGAVPPVGDRTADRYWKGGLIYINRSDPALFVEKRFGIGYTLNFGHPAAWQIVAGILAVPLLLALLRR